MQEKCVIKRIARDEQTENIKRHEEFLMLKENYKHVTNPPPSPPDQRKTFRNCCSSFNYSVYQDFFPISKVKFVVLHIKRTVRWTKLRALQDILINLFLWHFHLINKTSDKNLSVTGNDFDPREKFKPLPRVNIKILYIKCKISPLYFLIHVVPHQTLRQFKLI